MVSITTRDVLFYLYMHTYTHTHIYIFLQHVSVNIGHDQVRNNIKIH
jgi:hypothetical protein